MDAERRDLSGDVYDLVWLLGDGECHELVVVEDVEHSTDVLQEAGSFPFTGFTDVAGRPLFVRVSHIVALVPVEPYECEGHGILTRLGFDVVPLPTEKKYLPDGFPNIDLWMDGQLWELKTPQRSGGKLTRRINDGVDKWERLWDFGHAQGDTPRVVVDNRYGTMPDSDALRKLKTAMACHELESLYDAIFIASNGSALRLHV